MKFLSKQEIQKALSAVGVAPGQDIYFQSDLRRPGWVEGVKSREDFCLAYLDSIREVCEEDFTLMVPTYTTQVARYDMDFVLEETPSLMGLFSEFLRTHPESTRSVHPIKSFAAIGKRKGELCTKNALSDYGWGSPLHRFLELKGKVLTIGLESGYAIGSAHHLEAACCLPYVYNKLLKWKPTVNGVRDEKDYFASSRYLELDVPGYSLADWARHMRKKGLIRSSRLGEHWVHLSDYEGIFQESVKLLANNPYCLLKETPKFEFGKLPFDGSTAGRDGIGNKDDESEKMNWGGFYLFSSAYIGGDEEDLA